MKCSAVFFDRDGTVIYDRHYLHDPSGVELIPGVGEALSSLTAAGVDAFLVSNQSGIGRGYFAKEDFIACQDRLKELLDRYGTGFRDFRYCPHAPEEECRCRKPGIGMWESLRDVYGLEASSCIMIGDKPEDLLFGKNAGMAAAVLVLTGKGQKSAEKMGLDFQKTGSGLFPIPSPGPDGTCPFYAAKDAAEAVKGILSAYGPVEN